MFLWVLLVFGLSVVGINASDSKETPTCVDAFRKMRTCCAEKPAQSFIDKNETIAECKQVKKHSPNCDFEICWANKNGVATADGTIIKTKMIEHTERMYENEPELFDNIRDECINGDISKYGAADSCDLKKHMICFNLQHLKNCKKWSEDKNCEEMPALAEECLKIFS